MRFIQFTITICVLYGQSLAQLSSEDLFRQVEPSAISLTCHNHDGSLSEGTGFMALDEGVAVTAWHVVREAARVSAKFASGEKFDVSGWIDRDIERDIALIRVKVFGAPLVKLSPATPPVGSKAYVVGSPEGLNFSFSDGLISQVRIVKGMKLYQFTSPVSPGSSGSPVFDANGIGLGVVSFQFKMQCRQALLDFEGRLDRRQIVNERPIRTINNWGQRIRAHWDEHPEFEEMRIRS